MTKKIKANLEKILSEISKTKLVAVTKYCSDEDLESLIDLGQRDFGESKVDQLISRSQKHQDVNWHMIGHIQSNKISKLKQVHNLKYIHSIDSMKCLTKINNIAGEFKQKISLFLQVNITGEDEKFGITDFTELQKMYELKLHENLEVIGVMGMSKIRSEKFEEDATICFSTISALRDRLDKDLKLSMGMSSDYKIACALGSDFIRVGSLLFS